MESSPYRVLLQPPRIALTGSFERSIVSETEIHFISDCERIQ